MTTVAPSAMKHPRNAGVGLRPGESGVEYTLNVPLLIGTIVALAILIPTVYFWHSYQLGRTSTIYLERADVLEQEENYQEAATYLHRYLQVNRGDVDTRIRLAVVYGKSAADNFRRKFQAIEYYSTAVGLAPNRIDLRRTLAEFLLEMRQYSRAEDEANRVLERAPNDAVGNRIVALASYGKMRSGERTSMFVEDIIDIFKKAIRKNPRDLELASTLARIYRVDYKEQIEATRNRTANQTMNEVVRMNPGNKDALLARYRYRREYSVAGAEADIQQAVKLAPDDLEVLLAAGENSLVQAAQKSRHEDARVSQQAPELFKEAVGYFESAIKIKEKDERGHLGLGQAYRIQGDADQAITAWREGLSIVGQDNIELNVRVANALIVQRRLDEVEEVLEILDAAIESLAPRLTRHGRNLAQNAVVSLQAKWQYAQGNYRKAVASLKEVMLFLESQEQTDRIKSELFTTSMLLASSYKALEQWDEAARAATEAVRLRPESSQAKMELAAAVSHTGSRGHRHIKHLQELLNRTKDSKGIEKVFVSLFEALLRETLRKPEHQRDWREVDELVADPPKEVRTKWQYALLYSDYVRAKQQGDAEEESYQVLKKAEAEHSEDMGFLRILILVYERLGKPEDADRVFKIFSKELGTAIAVHLVHADLLAQRNKLPEAIKLLEGIVDHYRPRSQLRIRYGLTQLYRRQGNINAARKQLEIMLEEEPENAAMLRQIGELSFDARDFVAAEKWERRLRKVEGEEGSFWRSLRARRLIATAKDTNTPAFKEAIELQKQLISLRPQWSMSHLLQGMISRRQEDLGQAIAAFERAIKLGEARLGVYEQLIELLYLTRRYGEANRYFERIQHVVALSRRGVNVGIAIAEQQGDLTRAVKLAREAVKARPDDPLAKIQLGQALILADKLKEAERVILNTAKQHRDNVHAWNGLLAFYIRGGNKAKANKVLKAFPKDVGIEPAQREFILAQGYELLGDYKQAEAHYRKAQSLAPKDLAILMRIAGFMARTDLDKTEQVLRQVLKIDPDYGPARRALAQLLVTYRSGEAAWKEANLLLSRQGGESLGEHLDQRLQATILYQRGDKKSRLQARQILEVLVQDPKASVPGDHLMLARLLEIEKKYNAARKHYKWVAERPEAAPGHLVHYIEFLIRREKPGEAAGTLRRLQKAKPEHFKTLQTRARWLKAMGRTAQIRSLGDDYMKRMKSKISKEMSKEQRDAQIRQICANLGALYASVELYDVAEKWYRALERLADEAYVPLVHVLALQDRKREAIQLCLEKAKLKTENARLRAALVAAAVFSVGNSKPDDFELADPLFQQALRENPNHMKLLFDVAYVYTVWPRTSEAIELYKRILQSHPNHAVVLNNLAAILSEDPSQSAQAIKYINRAIALKGRQSALLDTKAMVLLEKDPKQAIQLLQEAMEVPKPDPRYALHLAYAYFKTGAFARSRKALQEARNHGLEEIDLSKSEKEMRKRMEEAAKNRRRAA